MNKKQHEFAMDTIPDWLRVVADPKSEEDHRLVAFLGTYGLNRQSRSISLNDSRNIMFLMFHVRS